MSRFSQGCHYEMILSNNNEQIFHEILSIVGILSNNNEQIFNEILSIVGEKDHWQTRVEMVKTFH